MFWNMALSSGCDVSFFFLENKKSKSSNGRTVGITIYVVDHTCWDVLGKRHVRQLQWFAVRGYLEQETPHSQRHTCS